MDMQIPVIDMAERSLVAAHKDAVPACAGEIERIHLRVLRIEEAERLSIGWGCNNPRTRTLPVCGKPDRIVRRARTRRRERPAADCAASQGNTIACSEDMRLRCGQRIPGMRA